KNPVVGYVRSQRDAITTADPAARAGDEEAIHAMRVATRRLRSTLKTFRTLWQPEQVAPLRSEVKWLGEHLGAVRDAPVQTRRLADLIDPDDTDLTKVSVRLRAHLGEQLDRGRTALGAALDDNRYLRLLDDLDRLCDTDPAPGGDLRRPARKALRKADRLLDSARDDEHLHTARKAYKQARYAAEVFVPSAGKPAKRLVTALTGLQDALGAHQDTVVARALLRELAGQAHQAGESGFGYGVLHARQQAVGEQALAGLPAARRRAGRRKLRNWL
ncbi:MAG TPA: CHAD domain-containing protein, partial [Actinoplanes sp.]|nr:CHAD domain-containing protein [Actinoplanes sp.]